MSLKILHLTGALSSSKVQMFKSNRSSGLGYMVFDIATELGKDRNLDINVLDYKERCQTIKFNGCNFYGLSVLKLIQNFSLASICDFFDLLKKYWKSRKFLKNLVYDFFASGYIESVIKNGSYDIVHFHGCDPMTELIRRYCRRRHYKFVITLHGLNSFGGLSKLDKTSQKYEKDMLLEWYQEQQYVSFVSTGSREKVLSYLKITDASTFCTIPNFTNISENDIKKGIDIRSKYNIPNDAFVILYIGNISRRKNQDTFVKAVHQLDDNDVEKIYVLFLGRDGIGTESIKDSIISGKNKKHMILCGNIPKNEIASFLSQGDATALISYSEGFGLGIIEGFRFGLPSLAISDMDGVPDFYSEDTMVLLKDRRLRTVCEGIKKIRYTRWDKNVIKEHSMHFTGSSIAKKYKQFYKNAISDEQ